MRRWPACVLLLIIAALHALVPALHRLDHALASEPAMASCACAHAEAEPEPEPVPAPVVEPDHGHAGGCPLCFALLAGDIAAPPAGSTAVAALAPAARTTPATRPATGLAGRDRLPGQPRGPPILS